MRMRILLSLLRNLEATSVTIPQSRYSRMSKAECRSRLSKHLELYVCLMALLSMKAPFEETAMC